MRSRAGGSNAIPLKDTPVAVIETMPGILKPDRLEVESQLALRPIGQRGMAKTVGIEAKVFGAARNEGVHEPLAEQGARDLNVIRGVATDE